jgi:hypothetical protein
LLHERRILLHGPLLGFLGGPSSSFGLFLGCRFARGGEGGFQLDSAQASLFGLFDAGSDYCVDGFGESLDTLGIECAEGERSVW